jgi:hypothetical protein
MYQLGRAQCFAPGLSETRRAEANIVDSECVTKLYVEQEKKAKTLE